MIFLKNGLAIEQHVMHTLKSFYYNTEVEVGIYGYAENQIYVYPQNASIKRLHVELLKDMEGHMNWETAKPEQTFSKVMDQIFHFYFAPILLEKKLMGFMIAGPIMLSRTQHTFNKTLLNHAVVKNPPRHQYLSQLMHQLMKTSLYIGPHEALEKSVPYMTKKDMHVEVEYASTVSKLSLIVDQVIHGQKKEALSIYNKSLLIGDFTDYEAEHAIMQIKQYLATLEALLSHHYVGSGHEPWKIATLKNNFYNQFYALDDYHQLVRCGEQLLETYAAFEKIKRNTGQTDCVKKANEYIQSHFKSHITIEDICAHTNVSKSTLSLYFKEEMHMTLGYAIKRARVDYAKHRLLNSKDSLLSIALDSGFENQNYFTTVFKSIEGITPYKYRMLKPRDS